jgi:GAF domain-containing protein
MTKAPVPPAVSDPERLRVLRGYAILDTPREEMFDDITLMASLICGTPIALLSLVDEARQWFKSSLGLDSRETPVKMAFCAHAMTQDDVMIVTDAREDPRFSKNALVIGQPRIRFYAGAPLLSPEGSPLGALCVIDTKPGDLTDIQRRGLKALARIALTQMELKRALSIAQRPIELRERLITVAGRSVQSKGGALFKATRIELDRAIDHLASQMPELARMHPDPEGLASRFDEYAEVIRGDAGVQDQEHTASRLGALAAAYGIESVSWEAVADVLATRLTTKSKEG